MRRSLAYCVIALGACSQFHAANVGVPPLGLPGASIPQGSPLTRARVDLGRKLFMDRRLSPNDTISCAMCHVPEQGFTSNEMATAVGIEGRGVRRNAPALYNVAYQQRLFDDGRESTLENQVWEPLLAHGEMGNLSIGMVIDKIRQLDDYNGLFEEAFSGRGPGMETVSQAVAAFERTLLSGNSRFDRWYYNKERDALDTEEQAGFVLFTGAANCAVCHTIGNRSALFTDQGFHNTGVGWARSMGYEMSYTVQLAPGVFTQIDARAIESFSEPPQSDVGRFEITRAEKDLWAYKTPSLRNVALTSPYMHDGSVPTLEKVIEFYDKGAIDNPGKDPLLKPLGLTTAQKHALAAFLRTLTGDNVEQLAKKARSG